MFEAAEGFVAWHMRYGFKCFELIKHGISRGYQAYPLIWWCIPHVQNDFGRGKILVQLAFKFTVAVMRTAKFQDPRRHVVALHLAVCDSYCIAATLLHMMNCAR